MADLPEIGLMFRETWELFLARLGPLLMVGGAGAGGALAALVLPPALVYLALGAGAPASVWVAAGVAALSASLWIGGWAQAAMVAALLDAEGRTWTHYIRATAGQVLPFSWVCLLAFVFTAGGACLLVVPGVYLGLALFFAPIVCLAEGVDGLAALERSLALARGRWWALALRFGLVAAATTLPSMVPVAGPVLSAAAAPFALANAVVLYRSMAALPPVAPALGPRSPRAFLLLCLLGFAWPIRATVDLVAAWPRVKPILAAQFGRLLENPLDPDKARRLLGAAQSGDLSTEAVRMAFELSSSSGSVGGLIPGLQAP